jgi:hypothetical protein
MKEPKIAIQSVKSSNIAGLGYDAVSKTLEVHFNSGAKHRFADVPPHLFTEFLQSDSKGSFFHQRVRGRFDSVKLGESGKSH